MRAISAAWHFCGMYEFLLEAVVWWGLFGCLLDIRIVWVSGREMHVGGAAPANISRVYLTLLWLWAQGFYAYLLSWR